LFKLKIVGKVVKKAKVTLDKLARMTANEFFAVRKNMATKDDLKELSRNMVENFTTKEDLKNFATKDNVKESEVKILQAVDGIGTKFDKAEKDHAADKLLHDRHGKWLERLEVGIRK